MNLTAVALPQLAAGLLLNLAYAWLAGSMISRVCLGATAQVSPAIEAMRRGEALAALVCLAATLVTAYAAAASMSGLALADAHRAFGTAMLRTSAGHGFLVALAAIAIALCCTLARRRRQSALGLALAAFAAGRAMTGHAAEDGIVSIAFAVEWLHLMATAVWLGVVALAAWMILPRLAGSAEGEPGRYLGRLSSTASAALALILATGFYNAFLRLGSLANASGNPYASVLLIKGGLVLLAIGIGAYNRWVGFPAALRHGSCTPAILCLLRVESVLLAGAVLAAVSLGAMAPPSSM